MSSFLLPDPLFFGFRLDDLLVIQEQAVALGQGHVNCLSPGNSQLQQGQQLLAQRLAVGFETPPSAGRAAVWRR